MTGGGTQAHAAVALDNDRALMCGGIRNNASWPNKYEITPNCYIYSASKDQWTSAPPLTLFREYHVMVMFNGMVVVNNWQNVYILRTYF
jgi:hypothetical protein